MPDNENLNPAEEPGTGTETGTEENTGAESGSGTGTGAGTGTGTEESTGTEETITALDAMIDRLNDEGEIFFVRDAWLDENGEMGRHDYGVVELTGSPMEIWGDDRMIFQEIRGNVIAYIMDGSDAKAADIQNILKGMADVGLTFGLVSREFLRDLMAIRWTWRFTLASHL